MATISDFLKHVTVDRYRQALGVEKTPSATVNGVPTGWNTVYYVGAFVERVFEFEGVPASIANGLTGSASVTDASGNTYAVSFDDAVTVAGTGLFELESNRVTKENISPHLWRIVVVHRTGSLVQ